MTNQADPTHSIEWPSELRRALVTYFSEEDLETLCFDLRISYENLPGNSKPKKVVELISLMSREGRVVELIDWCSHYRPNVPWEELREAARRDPIVFSGGKGGPPSDSDERPGPYKRLAGVPIWMLIFVTFIAILTFTAVAILINLLVGGNPAEQAGTPITPIAGLGSGSNPTMTASSTSMPPTATITPLPTETMRPTPTDTMTPLPTETIRLTPTDTPAPTFTLSPIPPTITPTPVLPDLTVVAISSPVCTTDHRVEPPRRYARHILTIRNIGSGSTSELGAFDNRIILDFGGQRYSLEEYASRFDGIVGSPNLNILDLGPNQDTEITLGLELRGFSNYAIEVTANSGPNTIPESDTTNNIRTQSFSLDCS